MKMNCWDFMNCGREVDGSMVKSLGNCPAFTFTSFQGTNNGFHSGRYCWYVAGTYSKTEPKCSHLHKIEDCSKCSFLKLVKNEEGAMFQS